jgi:hypothetical protein
MECLMTNPQGSEYLTLGLGPMGADMFQRSFLVFLCLFQPAALFAQETTKRTITVDDYFTQADIFELAIGVQNRVVYTEGRWQKSTDDRKADLWITGVDKSRRLTFDRASYRSPQWGPGVEGIKGGTLAGTVVYVLANRKREGEKKPPFDGKTQVWRILPAGLAGSDPQPVTQVEGGVEAFEVHKDASHLLYLVHHDHQADDFKDLREKFDQVEYGQGKHKTSQIWKLNLSTWRAEKMIDDGRYIHEFSLSPDGKRLAMITAPDETVVSFEGRSRIDIWEADKITTLVDDLWRKKAPSPYAWLERLAWSNNSQALAFNAIFDGYPAEIVVTQWENLTRPASLIMPRQAGLHVRGYGSPLHWRWHDNEQK